MSTPQPEQKDVMSPQDFARLGGGHVAYVREITGAQAAQMVGEIPDMPGNLKLYALHAADGSCLTIADTKDGALADAWENNLSTVSVH